VSGRKWGRKGETVIAYLEIERKTIGEREIGFEVTGKWREGKAEKGKRREGKTE
jgi:hypothetical protein